MKTVCAWLNKLIGCSVLVGLLLPTAIDADVLPITAVTVAEHPTLGTGEVLTDLTFDGVTWRQLVGGTASNITGGGVRFYSSDENTSDFGALLTGALHHDRRGECLQYRHHIRLPGFPAG